MGLRLKKKETEVMITSKKYNELKCSIIVDRTILKQVKKIVISQHSHNIRWCITIEVNCRIGQAKVAFQKMNILCNKNLSMEIIKQVLKTYLNTILYYGSEA
jgi:hypothetical protein